MGTSLVDDLAAHEEQQTLEGVENFGARLVDSGNDVDSSVRQVLEVLDDIERSRGIESGGRLVQEKHRRVREKLDSDGGSLSLSSGDSSDELVSDSGVLAFREPEFDNNIFDSLLLLLETDSGKSQVCDEGESFSGGKGGEEDIVLHDVGHVVGIFVGVLYDLLIQVKFSVDVHVVGGKTSG